MTAAVPSPGTLLVTLWSKSDWDDDLNTWTWDADLYRLADGAYRVTLTQCPGAPGDEDWVASEQDGLRDGSNLFEFLRSSLAREPDETLTKAAWRKVAKLVKKADGALGAGFEAAISEEFNPRELEKLPGPPEPLNPFENFMKSATWERPSFGGGGAMWAAIAFRLRMETAVAVYASRYLAANGVLPQGPHRVVQTYAPEGADFAVLGNPSDRGTVDQMVLFPATQGVPPGQPKAEGRR